MRWGCRWRTLAMTILLGLAASATRAQESSSLVPWVQHAWTVPAPPEPGTQFELVLAGYFPYDCGVITDTNVVATTVEFTMKPEPSPACDDTARSWSSRFPLGPLPEGIHTITLVRRLVREDGSTEVKTGSFDIRVGSEPPPAPSEIGFPFFSHFTTSPDPPNNLEPTIVTLYGRYPWSCGQILGSRILWTTYVEVTMGESSGCPDTARTWQHSFNLGVLPLGTHNLRIVLQDVATPNVSQEYGTWLTVTGDPPPLPPPPPTPPAVPLFSHIATVPSPASSRVPTELVVFGYAPYPCVFVTHAQVLSPSHVALTLRHSGGCSPADSVTAWSKSFALGMLPPGSHDVRISIRDAEAADTLGYYAYDASFQVFDLPPSPLPPPPADSLYSSRPNPFLDVTRFRVKLEDGAALEIGVFDIQGRQVRSLYRGSLPEGIWEFAWDGHRDDGSRASGGVYFYRLVRPGRVLSKRVVLLKPR